MYFQQINEIINGTKTQTRRIVKPREAYAFRYLGSTIQHYEQTTGAYNPQPPISMITQVLTPNGRLKWQVGRDYAVSPGRGKPGVWWNTNGILKWAYRGMVYPNKGCCINQGWLDANFYTPLRIVITAIRQERLQAISEDDARAEGCQGEWIDTGTATEYHPDYYRSARDAYRDVWNSINNRSGIRWNDNPQVWVLEFEVQQSGVNPQIEHE